MDTELGVVQCFLGACTNGYPSVSRTFNCILLRERIYLKSLCVISFINLLTWRHPYLVSPVLLQFSIPPLFNYIRTVFNVKISTTLNRSQRDFLYHDSPASFYWSTWDCWAEVHPIHPQIPPKFLMNVSDSGPKQSSWNKTFSSLPF